MPTLLTMPFTAALTAGIPSPSSAVWYLGPIPVRAYALCILTGVFVAVWWSDRRYRARGGRPEVVLDVAIVAVPAGIVGARLYHVVTSPDDYFGPNGDLARIPQTWQGGLGIWGGIAGGVLAGVLLLRHRGLRVAPLADAVGIPRFIVVSAYNWGQYAMLFLAPTGLVLVTLQMLNIPFNKWVKFVMPMIGVLLAIGATLLVIQVSMYGR